jgi:hypothetical protein
MISDDGRKFYYEALKIPVSVSGKFSIKHLVKKSGTKLPTATMRTSLFGGHENKDIFFDYSTTWHSLTEEDDGVWMTDLPIEQFQADTMLNEKVYGTVLVGGLGLGYAAQLIASQPQVDRIIVIEKSQDVVDLVWKHLRFPKGTEVHIEVVDLFDYLKLSKIAVEKSSGNDEVFDCGFYDIWRSDGEYTLHHTVIPLRQLSSTVINGPLYCWNEDIMRSQLLMSLHSGSLFMKNSHPEIKHMNLDELSTFNPEKGIWHNWKVPYYTAVKNKVFALDDSDAMVEYVKMYGRPDFADEMMIHLKYGE